ncbi:hypothetical protein CFY87_04690 [Actinobacillus seminis]|uniref:Uncharacterized protein n=1 Tax=Actinobacillus seminis TaxID=722 RepID=A0ABX4FNZ6_9PAST|nr:hypothetical protein CFY87_04690 [Actinobacillus seminis]
MKETFGNQNYNWKDAGAAAIGGATGALIGNSNAIRTASSVFFSSAAEGLFYSISKSINQSGSDYGDGCDYQ